MAVETTQAHTAGCRRPCTGQPSLAGWSHRAPLLRTPTPRQARSYAPSQALDKQADVQVEKVLPIDLGAQAPQILCSVWYEICCPE